MSRLCMRPGCDRDAASRLSYDAVGCQVWLDELTDRAGRHQEICLLHAERLTVPRGWFLCDRRSAQPAMFVAPEPTADAADPPAGPADPAKRRKPARSSRRRRTAVAADPTTQTLELFEVLRQELAGPALEPAAPPATPAAPSAAPAAPSAASAVEPETPSSLETLPEQEPRPVDRSEPDQQLPELLRATSPLLARAFAATGHQRSVLTQQGPTQQGSTQQESTEPSKCGTDEPERHHDD